MKEKPIAMSEKPIASNDSTSGPPDHLATSKAAPAPITTKPINRKYDVRIGAAYRVAQRMPIVLVQSLEVSVYIQIGHGQFIKA